MLLVISFVILMFLGMPLLGVIGLASIISLIGMPFPMAFIPQNLYTGMDQFPLIATIGFVMAGFLMEPAGITDEIIEVARKAVGGFTGGLAMVTILACMIFASLSGSGPATTAAIGGIMIPGMISAGYRKDDAAAVSATGGTLGILIPPSNPMILYGVVANTSVAALFMAGFIPGFVLTTLMCVTAYCIARKRGYKGTGERFSFRKLGKALWDGKWALTTPALILGGIYGGFFTPTEAAEVGVLWTLFVGLFIYRTLNWKNITSALVRTSAFAGSATVLVGVSMTFSRLLTLYRIPQTVGTFLASISTDPTVTLLLIAVFIFLCGFIADTLAMVVVLTPIFLPVTNALGINPIQLGILFVVCCETGFLTPPFGANLFITMKITDVKFEAVALRALPYLIAMWILIVVIAAFPKFVLFLPKLLM
ncbi:MAG: TRAP transporter large permease [Desulfovibrio sp.]|jgi:C4-dicarboxylate transporter DctM subunit|nr:TRAP transporter large permease [Desulfovibrio sp.]